MKQIILILSFTLGLTTAANAETWSCAYLFNAKAKNVIFTREGNRFYDADKTGYYEIVYEDDSMISLHRSYSTISPVIFAVLLDKTKNMFAMIGLKVENSTAINTGECKVF